jgi:hypothetical protein
VDAGEDARRRAQAQAGVRVAGGGAEVVRVGRIGKERTAGAV